MGQSAGMKIAPYRFDDGVRLARIEGEIVIDTGLADDLNRHLLPEGLALLAARAGAAAPLEPQRLQPLAPPVLLAVGLNYSDHAAEMQRPLPEVPALFAKLPNSIAGPYTAVQSPHPSLDYEGELAVVIGTPAWQVSEADACRHIAGYCILNDLTVRDALRPDSLILAKSGPGQAPLGPWLTTADEVTDPQQLAITTHVNGTLRQNGSTAAMHRSVSWLVAWLSRHLRLDSGTVIATGSPPGSGAGFSPPRYLQPGDTVRVAISGLGFIETRVEQP
jgi:2-keto-4-pentenoate hydratase/2-oxohepta-3-ene-1,7-dioic acid hydratase in catechol pathway